MGCRPPARRLCLTKLDVLDGFEEIKIGTKYIDPEGNEVGAPPANVADLDKLTVEYLALPGWNTSIKEARKFADLPEAAQAYVCKLEELLQTPGETPVAASLLHFAQRCAVVLPLFMR